MTRNSFQMFGEWVVFNNKKKKKNEEKNTSLGGRG